MMNNIIFFVPSLVEKLGMDTSSCSLNYSEWCFVFKARRFTRRRTN